MTVHVAARHLGDEQVADLVPMALAVDAVEDALRQQARGAAASLPRALLRWSGGRMQALGGYLADRTVAAVKSWVVAGGRAQPTLLLFSLEDGRLLATMDAAALGRIRTGAVAAVATRHLAAADAAVLLVVGAGRQAATQVDGALAVRSFRTVLVAARDPGRTGTFARATAQRHGLDCRGVTDVAAAAAAADVITTVTTATEPVLQAGWVRPGTHVNAIGAIVPGAVEVDPALFARARPVVADSVEQVLADSAALRLARDRHGLDGGTVVPLHGVVTAPPRRDPAAVSVFTSVGTGLADTAVAELAWRRHSELYG